MNTSPTQTFGKSGALGNNKTAQTLDQGLTRADVQRAASEIAARLQDFSMLAPARDSAEVMAQIEALRAANTASIQILAAREVMRGFQHVFTELPELKELHVDFLLHEDRDRWGRVKNYDLHFFVVDSAGERDTQKIVDALSRQNFDREMLSFLPRLSFNAFRDRIEQAQRPEDFALAYLRSIPYTFGSKLNWSDQLKASFNPVLPSDDAEQAGAAQSNEENWENEYEDDNEETVYRQRPRMR